MAKRIGKVPKGFAIHTIDLSGQNADAFHLAGAVKQILRLGPGSLSLLCPHLFLKGFNLFQLALEGRDNLILRSVEEASGGAQSGEGALVFGEGAVAGDGLDSADASSGGLLAHDFEYADFAGAMDVGASAKLLAVEAAGRGRVRHGDDADVGFRIFVAEKGEGAGGEGIVDIHDVGADFEILANFFVYLLLDIGKLAGIDGGEMRKIEAQMVGSDERAGLFYVRAENIAQRGVHQMRGGVVAHVARAALGIGDGSDAITDMEVFFGDDAMSDESGDRVVGASYFGDFQGFGVVVEAASVGDLAA